MQIDVCNAQRLTQRQFIGRLYRERRHKAHNNRPHKFKLSQEQRIAPA
jgi:hypothetical protein